MSQQEASAGPVEPVRKRAHPGTLGEGTPGKRIKSAWKASGSTKSLRQWLFVAPSPVEPAIVDLWVQSKTTAGSLKQRAERKEARERHRHVKSAGEAPTGPSKKKKGGKGGSR